MPPPVAGLELEPLAGATPAWRALCDPGQWLAACEATAASGGRLGALWASDARDTVKERGALGGFSAHALLVTYEGLLWLELPVAASAPGYPDLATVFPCARRMQRAAFDLVGLPALTPEGSRPDSRGW